MTKLNLRYLYAAGAGALIAAAAIAIPAWASSGGGDSGTQGRARGVPGPPPPVAGAFGLTAQASTPAEARRMRSQLDDFATCMRNQGADVPGGQRRGTGVSVQMARPQASATVDTTA